MRSGDDCQEGQPAQSKAANKSEIWEGYYHVNRERRVLGDGRRSHQGRERRDRPPGEGWGWGWGQGAAGLAGEKKGATRIFGEDRDTGSGRIVGWGDGRMRVTGVVTWGRRGGDSREQRGRTSKKRVEATRGRGG